MFTLSVRLTITICCISIFIYWTLRLSQMKTITEMAVLPIAYVVITPLIVKLQNIPSNENYDGFGILKQLLHRLLIHYYPNCFRHKCTFNLMKNTKVCRVLSVIMSAPIARCVAWKEYASTYSKLLQVSSHTYKILKLIHLLRVSIALINLQFNFFV